MYTYIFNQSKVSGLKLNAAKCIQHFSGYAGLVRVVAVNKETGAQCILETEVGSLRDYQHLIGNAWDGLLDKCLTFPKSGFHFIITAE